jgi:hypothetical protein
MPQCVSVPERRVCRGTDTKLSNVFGSYAESANIPWVVSFQRLGSVALGKKAGDTVRHKLFYYKEMGKMLPFLLVGAEGFTVAIFYPYCIFISVRKK